MSTLLLLVIYLVFISLGLPDSLIGSTWPAISKTLEISEDLQGILTASISVCTIISAFLTPKLLPKIKEKGIVLISILLTAVGLILISFSQNFYLLILSCIPLGIGAGAIDTTLNNYVAINYKSIHLNWLHAFWGVGASISPFICAIFLTDLNGWRNAALVLAIIQFSIWFISLLSVPLWKICELKRDLDINKEENKEKIGFLKTIKYPGVLYSIIAFFAYIAIESTSQQWFSSMVVFDMGVKESLASSWTSLFFIGITVGRLLSGLISLKINDKNMIRIGESVLFIGIILLTFKFNVYIMPAAIFLIGFGCAPIYPSIIHATPTRFGEKMSPFVMAIQVGCAYIANITVSPLFGVIGKSTTFLILPYVLLFILIILVLGNELVLIRINKEKKKPTQVE